MAEPMVSTMSIMPLSVAPVFTDPWQATIGGLMVGPGTPYGWTAREGIEELPPFRTDTLGRPNSHGTFVSPIWADGRTLEFSFRILRESRWLYGVTYEDAVAAYRRAMIVPADQSLVPVWINVPGRGAVRWDVQVVRHRIATDPAYDIGLARLDVQMFAPDPFGYGDDLTATTGLPLLAGGLEFDLFTDGVADTGYLEFGESGGSTGRLSLDNDGTAPSSQIYRVAGPVAGGFEILDVPTGRRLRFEGDVAESSTVSIDTATGVVLLDDVADRSGSLTVREWTPVPAGSSTEIMFLPLGSYSAATLTVTWAPAWW